MSRPLMHALGLALCTAMVPALTAQAPATTTPIQKKEARMTTLAKGSFEVTVAPLSEGARKGVWTPGRMSIDKRFQGDLEGSSQGEMLTAMTEEQGSAGYTAIERVQGSLQGRKGSFILQHNALMTRGVPGPWTVLIVPDSGTEGLKGITGQMTITITGKEHSYALEYLLPAAP